MALTCRVVTPDKTYFDGAVEHVVVPAWNGEMAFYSNHAPLIGQLGDGILRAVQAGGQTTQIAIFGGFVKVKDNVVLVLAGGAELASNIDAGEAKVALEAARKEHLEKRPPVTDKVEFSFVEEALVRAEVRHAAATNALVPIHEKTPDDL